MTTYLYEPLDYSKAQIRLLMLHPAPNYSDPIRISLHKVPIPQSCLNRSLEADLQAMNLASEDSDVEKPDFSALSYVWGSSDDPAEAIVESAPDGVNTISITRNLDVALRHLRSNPMPNLPALWVDAICIDQGNLGERSHQVAIMDSIYSIALRTIVWLGPEENYSRQAMSWLVYLGRRVQYSKEGLFGTVKSQRGSPGAPPPKPNEETLGSRRGPLPFGTAVVRAIISLLERPWFTRLWIRQEIALASHARVMCGMTMTRWDDFKNGAICFIDKVMRLPADLDQRFHKLTPTVMTLVHHTDSRTSYEFLRDDLKSIKFTDPRDIIYAMKRLLSKDDSQLGVRPDYTLDTAEVFSDVCVRIVERQGQTYFLGTCELNSISTPNLPSWVPDWSKPMTARHPPIQTWSACGFISADATYLGDGVLRVAGIQIAKIRSIQSLGDPTDVLRGPVWLTHIEKVFRQVQDLYPGDAYVDSGEKQSILDAYCRTFNMGVFENFWDPPHPEGLTFDQAKLALKRVWSLDAGWIRPENLLQDRLVDLFLWKCYRTLDGSCFFTAKDGCLGVAPLGTQSGDIISIILGCPLPIILRKDHASSAQPDETRWKVVGPASVDGLMAGEAIYGILPSYYRPVHYLPPRVGKPICGLSLALLDTRTNELKTNPAAILQRFGIQPTVWTRQPHRLEVSATVLREAGVKLCDFFLV